MCSSCARLLREHTWFSIRSLIALGLATHIGRSIIIRSSCQSTSEDKLILLGVIASVSAVCCEIFGIGDKAASTSARDHALAPTTLAQPVLAADRQERLYHSVDLLMRFPLCIWTLLVSFNLKDQRLTLYWPAYVKVVFSILRVFYDLITLQITSFTRKPRKCR